MGFDFKHSLTRVLDSIFNKNNHNTGDYNKTIIIKNLLKISKEKRDEKWIKSFLDNIDEVILYTSVRNRSVVYTFCPK